MVAIIGPLFFEHAAGAFGVSAFSGGSMGPAARVDGPPGLFSIHSYGGPS